MTAIEAPTYGSDDWVQWRTHGLGASDLPTVAGCNPWQTEYQLWAQKRGIAAPFEGNEKTRWGHRMEAIGIEVYTEATGRSVVTGETFADPRWPHLWATLDGRVPDERIGVEVKWTARWDTPPQSVEVQALAQMGLADLVAVDVVRMSPYGEPTIHRIERDDAAVDDLLALGEAWFVRYVLGDEAPPYDESPESRRALLALRGTEERPADGDQRTALARLREVRDALGRLETAEKALVRDLKASMAGAGVLVAPGLARATWSVVKPRTSVAWQQVAEGLRTRCTDEEWESVVSLATTVGEPGDRFAVKFDETMEEAAA